MLHLDYGDHLVVRDHILVMLSVGQRTVHACTQTAMDGQKVIPIRIAA